MGKSWRVKPTRSNEREFFIWTTSPFARLARNPLNKMRIIEAWIIVSARQLGEIAANCLRY